jgi:Superinfection immunity protein
MSEEWAMETVTGILTVAAALYFLPWLIALLRGHHNAAAIFMLNLLLGWTGLGWVVALVWSMTSVQQILTREEIAFAATRAPSMTVGATVDELTELRRTHDYATVKFVALAFLLLIIIFAMIEGARAGSIGHAPYRGNAAPGMMNRGPEADYYNTARPPIVTVPSYGGTVYRGSPRPFVAPDDDTDHFGPSTQFGPGNRFERGLESAPARQGDEALPSSGRAVFHNGSLMRVILLPDGMVQIRYATPRPELRIPAGTLLVTGRWIGPEPQTFAGAANIFPPVPCLPIAYGVRGTVDKSNNLVLFGPAPIVGPDCTVVGHDWTRNSELRFEQVR